MAVTKVSREMPDVPHLVGCVCFGGAYAGACMCGPTEMALRAWSSPTWNLVPMTPVQREWCLTEIDAVEGHSRADHEDDFDGVLASSVLNAWRDYCRDKGIY